MQASLYRPGGLKRLKRDGLVLEDLVGAPSGQLYRSTLWRFAPSAEGSKLPYHRFRAGDSIQVSPIMPEGSKSGLGSTSLPRAKLLSGTASPSESVSGRYTSASLSGSSAGSTSSTSQSIAVGSEAIRPRGVEAVVSEVFKSHLIVAVEGDAADVLEAARLHRGNLGLQGVCEV